MVTCAYPANLVTPVTPAVFAAHVHEHPLVTYYRATGDGSPVKISDFLSRERFRHLGLHAEFFLHLPIEHQLAVSLPSPDTRVVGIPLNRSSGDFTKAGRDLVRRRTSPDHQRQPQGAGDPPGRARRRCRHVTGGPARLENQ